MAYAHFAASPGKDQPCWSTPSRHIDFCGDGGYVVTPLSAVAISDGSTRPNSLLRTNARRPLREIASAVGLTVAPVQRRIARMERLGVIERYTVEVKHARIANGIEAMTELQFADDLDLAQIMEFVAQIPELEEVLTLARDPDALFRIRVEGIEDLRRVVSSLRAGDAVATTKTLVILEHWSRLT